MEFELLVAVGARGMLTSNLWTKARVSNRALGIALTPHPPTYVLVIFNNYLGVPWVGVFPQCVPIAPTKRDEMR